ncbi:MAG: sulfatase, partial [Bacteroidales bacterium]|nr:sulfatase [Bacteroidales bacterium]
MKRTNSIIALFLLILFAWGCADSDDNQQPNILFIMSDDHAFQAISAYDKPIGKLALTPQIDRIANQGMIFQNMYVANSLCGPSRACIITGKFSHINGFKNNGNKFNPDQASFPKILHANGYQTAVVGKWHLKSQPQGFDFWEVLPGQGHYYNPNFLLPDDTVQIQGYVTNIITDLAIEWLENGRDKSKPFLLMCQHKAPHREWLPEGKYLDYYHKTEFPEPDNLFDDHKGMGTAAQEAEMLISKHMALSSDNKILPEVVAEKGFKPFMQWYDNAYYNNLNRMNPEQRARWEEVYAPITEEFKNSTLQGDELTSWKYQRFLQDYLACIKSVDDNVGRLLDYLEENGLDENTIVVYTSDQGFYLGEHGWFDKRFMYEESFRTPLLVKYPPTIKAGSSSTMLAQNVDFAPTLLEMAGIEIPTDMQGMSLLPLFEGEGKSDNWRTALYYHYYEFPSIH